jgi:hypothetical protein
MILFRPSAVCGMPFLAGTEAGQMVEPQVELIRRQVFVRRGTGAQNKQGNNCTIADG